MPQKALEGRFYILLLKSDEVRKETSFPENSIIGGIIRGNDSFIAVGDTVIPAVR